MRSRTRAGGCSSRSRQCCRGGGIATTTTAVTLLVAVASLVTSSAAQQNNNGNIPRIDYDALGSVGVVGSFAALELYDPASSYVAPLTGSANAASLLSLNISGYPQRLGSVDGQILAIAECGSEGGLYFGGNFSRVDGALDARNIGVYFPANNTVATLAQGLDGPVSALTCDSVTATLHVGGSFNRPVGTGPAFRGAVASWSIADTSWNPLGFGGFAGDGVDIRSITVTPQNSLLFAGQFDTYWQNEVAGDGSSNVTVTTLANGTVSISTTNSSLLSEDGSVVNVTPSLGSSLVPISLATAEISSSASSARPLYSDAASVFCPSGNDGEADSTWLAEDGNIARITARIFAPLEVGGFRLGNTNVEGRGTRTFSITAIPSNELLTLSYRTDPTSASSPTTTCSSSCPLGHSASVPYEDFLIASTSGATTITGFQLTVSSYYGDSAGLHLVQLLSAGSISYAIDGQNRGYGQGVCASGPYAVYGRSSSVHTPTENIPWDHTEVASSTVSGTSEGVLCAATPVDTDPALAPEATWYPYIGQDGTYELFYFTPACAFDATCGQRGFVDVTVEITGADGVRSSITTVNQEVTLDTRTSVYNGAIAPIGKNEQVKVTMKLSSRGRATLAPGRGDKYYLIADKVIVIARNTDGNGSTQVKVGTGMNAVNVSTADNTHSIRYTRGYGLWEWMPSDGMTGSPTLDTASTAPQAIQSLSSATSLDQLSFNLGPASSIDHVTFSEDGAFVFLGGDFNYSDSGTTARSILGVASGTMGLVSSPQGGLNGPVTGLAVSGGWLYVVGNFSASGDGSITDLAGKARYQYASLAARWQAVPGLASASSQASTVSKLGETLLFTYANHAPELWDTLNETSLTSEGAFVIGSFDASAVADNDTVIYLGGGVSSLNRFRSSGLGMLSSEGIKPASFGLDHGADAEQRSTVTPSAAGLTGTSPAQASGLSLIKNRLRKRQAAPPATAVPTSLPTLAGVAAGTPQVLAGAIWQNSTTNEHVTILGGSFTSLDGGVQNLGVLQADGTLGSLGTQPVTGVVRSLKVVGDILWIGGDFAIASTALSALAAYDLASGTWQDSAQITAASGSPIVTAFGNRSGRLLVAGQFSSIGGVACSSVCELDTETKQWTGYGEGVNGIVSQMAVMESTLLIAGSFVANNTSFYLDSWNYDTSSWSPIMSDSLSGPALAISADSESNVFVSGVVSDNSDTTYLTRWNGEQWSAVPTDARDSHPLDQQTSAIQQMVVVPLTTEQPRNSIFPSTDRGLLVSGIISLANFGVVSSALFDGTSWHPYLLASGASGEPGAVSSFFYSAENVKFGGHHHLAVGIVILISIAISLGIIFLCVLIALIITLSTRHEESQPYPIVIPHYDNTDWAAKEATSPTPLMTSEKGKERNVPMLETLGAATAAISSGHPDGIYSATRERHETQSSRGAQTSSEGESIYDDVEEGDDSLPLRGVRYSFDAEREEELSISTADMVEVVDDADEHWHIVRRLRDGRQGLVPSAFLT